MNQGLFFVGIILEIAALAFSLAFLIYAWRKRNIEGAKAYLLLMAAISGWIITSVMTGMPEIQTTNWLYLRLTLFLQGILPGALLLFTLQYTRYHRWLKGWRPILLFILPAIIVLYTLITPSIDELLYNQVIRENGQTFFKFGWLYHIFWAYLVASIWVSFFLFRSFMQYQGQLYQRLHNILLFHSVFLSIVVFIVLFFPSAIFIQHYLPLSFAIFGITIGFGIYRYHLFDLNTITYHDILDDYRDALIIFDKWNRLLFANQSMAKLLEFDAWELIGCHISKILGQNSIWRSLFFDDEKEILVEDNNTLTAYEAEIIYLPKAKQGWNQKLRIISETTVAFEATQAEKEARAVAEIRASELDVLRIIAEKLNGLAGFEDVLQSGLVEIITRLGARFGYVVLANHNGRPYLASSHKLPSPAEQAFKDYPFCPNCPVFERFMDGSYQEPVAYLPCAVLDTVSISYPGLISVPLKLAERQIGVLNLVMAPNTVFSGDEIRLLQTIGDQYCAAIERARLYEEAERMATIDPLTGLNNRRCFFDMAQIEFERALRYQHPVSIIMLDIDFFKNVNDSHGHLIGDAVLKIIADRCRMVLRSSDKIGRYGGEEFVILLPQTALSMAEKTAERIRKLVCDRPLLIENVKINMTVSLGVSCMDEESSLTLEQVLDQADQALHKAKHSGRNRVRTWQDPYVVGGLFNRN